jgi:hypothetical protein
MPIVKSQQLSAESYPAAYNKYAATAIYRAVSTVSTFWHNLGSVVSSAGALFGRFAVFASKQHLFARKGMGFI